MISSPEVVDSSVFLSVLPYLCCKKLGAECLRTAIPRLCSELESEYEEVALQCSRHLLRMLKEFRQNNVFHVASNDFLTVFGVVKRLCGSVKISRMRGAMPRLCSDLKELLALEFT